MLAYEYRLSEQSGPLSLVEKFTPRAAHGEVVVDVAVAGVCGTDLKIARGEHRLYPEGTIRVPGHEFVGRVRENRSECGELIEGTLIAVAPNIGCGACTPCQAGRTNLCLSYRSAGLTFDGGFAESVVLPARAIEQGNALVVPDDLDPLVAVLMEPLAAVLRGLKAIRFQPGESLVVCGAGPIGLLTVILAAQMGAGRIIVSQTSQDRRRLAEQFGADVTINPREDDLIARVHAETNAEGADCIVVAAPASDLFTTSLELAAVGGRINFFAGLPTGLGKVKLDVNLVHYRELTITGTSANTQADCAEALQLLERSPEAYRPLVTHRYPLEQAEQAFKTAESGSALKVVIEP